MSKQYPELANRNWFQRLIDRIPRRMYQIGMSYNDESSPIYWRYVLDKWDAELIRDEEQGFHEDDCSLHIRRVWLSPAWLDTQEEFQGW